MPSTRNLSVRNSALITGASDGLGLELARQMLAKGWTVGIVVRSRDKALSGGLAGAALYQADLSQASQAFISDQELCCYDVLVNNAGASTFGSFESLTSEQIQQLSQLNFVTPLVLMNRFLRMAPSNAMVVNVSSITGQVPMPFNGLYSACKAAMIAVTQLARIEGSSRDVKILDFCPGSISTNFQSKGGATSHVRAGQAMSAAQAAGILLKAIEQGKTGVIRPDKVAKVLALATPRLWMPLSRLLARKSRP